ncbi:MAG TPA: LacI family DNA-binding transcriptional regulator [Terrimicrobiaceae bacterium]|nr:LacI family DNA-binding transcriptional regulator [Terrimicrobiaceae bacterium]
MSKVTQSTIARIHGVSRQAVGSALGLYTNSNIKLSAKVRESIIATAKELGYRPNRFAQIISGRKSGVIGVMNFGGITQMGSQNALYAARAIQESGFQLMLYDVTWYQKGGIETVLSALLDNRVEGLLLIAPTEWMPAEVLDTIKKQGIPMVALGGVLLEGVPRVESDCEADMQSLVNGLLQAGYQSLIYLTSWASKHHDEVHSSSRLKRMRGFRRTIEAAGGVVHDLPSPRVEGQISGEIFLTPMPTDWDDPYHIGELAMRQVLARKELPEVVLCANDDWAAGVMKACGQAGIPIPEKISVTGNDGTVISGYGYIPLTTTIQPLAAMARKAMELLTLLIEKEPLPEDSRMLKIPGEVAWRDSTRVIHRD